MDEETNSYKILKGKVGPTLQIIIYQNVCLTLVRATLRVFREDIQL